MALFDDISKKLTDVGQSTLQKTKDFADMGKYKSMIADEEKKLTEAYVQIGKKFMAEHTDEQVEGYTDFFNAINEAKAKIEEFESEIVVLKGSIRCTECGGEIPAGSQFCPTCGAAVKLPEPAPEPKKIYCKQCGNALNENIKFCTSCGAAIE